MEVTRR